MASASTRSTANSSELRSVSAHARLRVRDEIAERAAAHGNVVGYIDHSRDVAAAQSAAAEALGDQGVTPARREVGAGAAHVRDVDAVAAVAEGDRLFVDPDHV